VVAFVFSDRVKGIAGKLSPVRFNIVSARGFGVYAKSSASIRNDGKLACDVVDFFVRDETEAEVAEVVKDGAASRKSARKKNAVLLHSLKVAFGARILIFAYDDRCGILPEKEDLRPLPDIRSQKLLRRKVAVRVI
jgi:hypothetical protein